DCGGAIALTVNPDLDCGVTTSGTITSATASGVTSTCFGTADDDVWFSFVATGTRHRIELLNVAGSTTDLYHALWRGTCAGLELVPGSCSDPNTSNPANLTVGTTYYVQVYTYTATVGQSTTFSVCIGTPPPPPPPPANDDCGGAIALTVNPDFNCGVTTPGTIAGATASGVTSTCGGTADDDVWFSFVATGTTHRIVLGDIAGSITDLYHAVWRGTCNGLVLVPGSCSDPNTSNPTGLSAGTTYYVQVYTYTATAGQNTTFSVCVGVPPPPPANDDCAGAIALTVNPDYSCAIVTAGTTQSATASVQPDVDSGTPNDDVWFSFVATDAIHRVSLLNVSGSTDMGHSIYRALPDPCAPTGMTLVLTSDPNSSEPSGLIIGDTYYVRVYSWGAAATGANFDICVSTRVPAINDVCTAAVPLTVNTNYDCAARTWGTVFGATASNVTSTCGGTADDDVWFSFTALATTHRIVLGDVSGSTTDLYHALWRGTCDGLQLVSGSCSDPNTSNPASLLPDSTYYLQVYTYTATTGQNTSFSVCIGSDPSIGIGIGESVMGANMRVYPNPAQDQITFDVNDANVQRVRMVDAAGRHVLDAPFTRVLNVASLEAGAYTALLFDRNGAVIARSRFVKE
ncbi:MAG: T9SS type A sorting domain-containing protein, partial [Flavobacteriales bacterium]|nr:T9SS type A sorting domain-containing protein [Flavobacteriales bacterium]